MQKIKVNDIITLDIKRMGINGEGIGYFENLAIFVDHVLPGEKAEVQITEVFENRAVAKLIKIDVESINRIDPFCPVFDDCGGCQTQHFNYDSMLDQKRDILVKSLDRYLKNYDRKLIKKTIGMENPMHYRNKASLPLRKHKGKNRFGMYERGTNTFIPIDSCGVQHKLINDVFTSLTELMDELNIDSFDPKTQKGDISHAVVRVTENLGEIQVSLIVPKRLNDTKSLVFGLTQKHPEIKSIFEIVETDFKSISFIADKTHLIYGLQTIDEKLNNYDFELKPEAFFQLNTYQAEKFYHKMEQLASLTGNEIVIDAYAGIAPISHYIHKNAKKVYAIEINKDSAFSAEISLKKNNITNVEVINKEFSKALETLNEKIDVMVFDPPRLGLGIQTINLIKKYKPNRLVYGSCNPSTLAKDLNELVSMYNIIEVTPFDMFPYTSLVESIVLLELKMSM